LSRVIQGKHHLNTSGYCRRGCFLTAANGVSLPEYVLASALILVAGVSVLAQMQNGFGHQMQAMWSHTPGSSSDNTNAVLSSQQASQSVSVDDLATTNNKVETANKTYCNTQNECITVTADSLIETAATFGETQRSLDANAELLTQLYERAKVKKLNSAVQEALYHLSTAAHTMGEHADELERNLGASFKSGDLITQNDPRYAFVKNKISTLTNQADTRNSTKNFNWDSASVGAFYATYQSYMKWFDEDATLKAELESLPGGKDLFHQAVNTVYTITSDLNYKTLADGSIQVNVNPTAQIDFDKSVTICQAGGKDNVCK
jgi:hypothetical protein